MSSGNPIWFQAFLLGKLENVDTFVICFGYFLGGEGEVCQFQFVHFLEFLPD